MVDNTTISISKENRKYLDDAAYERRLKSADAALTAVIKEAENFRGINMVGIEREVMFKGDKCYINMPREWANKKVKVIEVR